jgi:FADH2 O2-dependent halogenase
MSADFDLAIVGSGFAGTLLAMIARRLGLSVLMIERGRHPRFAIGESSTPLANLWLETLADRYDLPRLRPLSQWGTWQASYPHLGCGLKRGFSYFHHLRGKPWQAHDDRSDQLLVAASPSD